jgi:hypothetical protein
MTLELEIVSNDLNIRKAVVSFTQRRCITSYRDIALDFLLDENTLASLITSLEKTLVESSPDNPIVGCTYQSSFRNQVSLKDVSHVIKSIRINENNIYAIVKILDTPSGRMLKELTSDQMVLKPVYQSNGIISTFDIDFINNQAA